MTPVTYIGLDPGKFGGLAWILDGRATAEALAGMTERDTWEVIRDLALEGDAFAVLEFVRSSPQMGVVSAFSFGGSYYALRAWLIAAGIPFTTVAPSRWQQVMQCRSGGNKNVTKARAQELFPGLKITHAIADALLLAEYCRRMHR